MTNSIHDLSQKKGDFYIGKTKRNIKALMKTEKLRSLMRKGEIL